VRDPHVIGFAGLSHLGIVSSIAAAAKDFHVVGFDPDSVLCSRLTRGDLPILEPGLPELLEQHRDRVAFTADASTLSRCDVIFFSIDVPTDASNQSDLTPLNALIDRVSAVARPDAVRVVLSQVPPGFTRARGLDHCQVETLIFGRAVERALQPERIIVGCEDPAEPVASAYGQYLRRFECPVVKMGYESAELAKIAINLFLVSSVSTTNTLAELCELVGAEWSDIAPALRLDRRIGPYAYLEPGLGIAGGNLERDLTTIRQLAAQHGASAGVVSAWLTNSEHRRKWPLSCLAEEQLIGHGSRIALWGIAYKPDTASIKNSPTLALLETLNRERVTVYDPAATLPEGQFPDVTRSASALDACAGADALIVMTPWREFSEIDLAKVATSMHGRILVDPYGAIDRTRATALGFIHYRLGSPAARPVPH
jgi:UDPglucose 6-dehydrogenase